MYLSCPACYTSFVVTDEQIGPSGRRVRCSKCHHGWFAASMRKKGVTPFTDTAKQYSSIIPDRIGATTNNFKPGVNLPALLPINIPIYLYLAPILLAAAIIFSAMILFQDKLSFIGLVGTSDKLSVHDINIEYDRELGNIIASYKIVNMSEEFIPLPHIRIRLLDAKHHSLKSHVASNTNTDLAPKQYVPVRTIFADAPPNVEFIDITLGNILDFILR